MREASWSLVPMAKWGLSSVAPCHQSTLSAPPPPRLVGAYLNFDFGLRRCRHAREGQHLGGHRPRQPECDHLLDKRPARKLAVLHLCDETTQCLLVHGNPLALDAAVAASCTPQPGREANCTKQNRFEADGQRKSAWRAQMARFPLTPAWCRAESPALSSGSTAAGQHPARALRLSANEPGGSTPAYARDAVVGLGWRAFPQAQGPGIYRDRRPRAATMPEGPQANPETRHGSQEFQGFLYRLGDALQKRRAGRGRLSARW